MEVITRKQNLQANLRSACQCFWCKRVEEQQRLKFGARYSGIIKIAISRHEVWNSKSVPDVAYGPSFYPPWSKLSLFLPYRHLFSRYRPIFKMEWNLEFEGKSQSWICAFNFQNFKNPKRSFVRIVGKKIQDKFESFQLWFVGGVTFWNFHSLFLLQIAAKCFQTCPEFTSQWSSKNYVGDFWHCELLIFNNFFRKFQIQHCVAYGEIINYLENGWL